MSQGAYIHYGQARIFKPVINNNGQRGININYGYAQEFAPVVNIGGREGIMDYVPDVSSPFSAPVVKSFVPLTTEGNIIYK